MPEEISDIIAFAEAYKGPGWSVSSAIESFRYKDSGEKLWSVNMVNTHRFSGPGETEDRLLISRENGTFQARRVELNRYLNTRHYRRTNDKSA